MYRDSLKPDTRGFQRGAGDWRESAYLWCLDFFSISF